MHRFRIALAIAAFAVASCNRQNAESRAEEAAPSNAPVTEAPAPAPKPFQPPADGLLQPAQAKKFLLAHQALMKLNEIYLDRLDQAGPEAQQEILRALELAREKAARKYGLNGYAEYRWILEEAPRHAENVKLMQRLNVSVVGGGS